MRALMTAAIYFGTFLTLGYVAKWALDRWTAKNGSGWHAGMSGEGDPNRRGKRFLLGAWYN